MCLRPPVHYKLCSIYGHWLFDLALAHLNNGSAARLGAVSRRADAEGRTVLGCSACDENGRISPNPWFEQDRVVGLTSPESDPYPTGNETKRCEGKRKSPFFSGVESKKGSRSSPRRADVLSGDRTNQSCDCDPQRHLSLATETYPATGPPSATLATPCCGSTMVPLAPSLWNRTYEHRVVFSRSALRIHRSLCL